MCSLFIFTQIESILKPNIIFWIANKPKVLFILYFQFRLESANQRVARQVVMGRVEVLRMQIQIITTAVMPTTTTTAMDTSTTIAAMQTAAIRSFKILQLVSEHLLNCNVSSIFYLKFYHFLKLKCRIA